MGLAKIMYGTLEAANIECLQKCRLIHRGYTDMIYIDHGEFEYTGEQRGDDTLGYTTFSAEDRQVMHQIYKSIFGCFSTQELRYGLRSRPFFTLPGTDVRVELYSIVELSPIFPSSLTGEAYREGYRSYFREVLLGKEMGREIFTPGDRLRVWSIYSPCVFDIGYSRHTYAVDRHYRPEPIIDDFIQDHGLSGKYAECARQYGSELVSAIDPEDANNEELHSIAREEIETYLEEILNQVRAGEKGLYNYFSKSGEPYESNTGRISSYKWVDYW